jgi:YD repeat-containing protein
MLTEASQGARTWSFDYHVSGRLEAATDPLSRADSLYYDLADCVRKQVLAGAAAVRVCGGDLGPGHEVGAIWGEGL